MKSTAPALQLADLQLRIDPALMLSRTVLSFRGLRHMPVGKRTAVQFLSPMIAMLLSGWLLKQCLAPAQGWFAAMAFAGAAIVIRHGAGIFGWAVRFALGVAFFNGPFQLLTRSLAGADKHPVFAPRHFFRMKAFALDTTAAFAPYSCAQIVFAMLGGWIAYLHMPDRWATTGMLLVVASGFTSGVMRSQRKALLRRVS